MVDSDGPTENERRTDEYWWNWPWSKRQTLLACFLVGWAGAIAIVAIGDYRLHHRLPTLREVGTYMLVGLILAPMIAGVGWLMSEGTRRRVRGGNRDEQ